MSDDPSPEGWLTKGEAAHYLGGSLAMVTRYTAQGKLHPMVMPDKTNRYDPEELRDCKEQSHGRGPARAKPRVEEFKEIELDTVRALVELVKDPREKIDTLLFRIIERLEKENAEIRAELKANRLVVSEAEDTASDRRIAEKLVTDESKVKTEAAHRLMATVGALFGGRAGVQLTPEQLQELILAGGFLTKEQEDQAKKLIVAAHSGKANGKAAEKIVIDEKPVETPKDAAP